MTEVVRLYGMTIRSEVPLHQDRRRSDGGAIDLEVAMGEPMRRDDATPPGRLLLDLRVDRRFYAATEEPDGYLLRFFGCCDVTLDRGLTRASVRPVEGGDRDLVTVLVSGALLAFVLAMKGTPVLHASAVQVGDVALGFVGSSGMGKSTLATLMCAAGAALVTDDVLALDLSDPRPRCALGATELRLRAAAAELATQFEDAVRVRVTSDAREAVSAPSSRVERLPLAGLVVPQPDRSRRRSAAEITRVDERDALLLLARFPRLLGWVDSTVQRRSFQHLGEIAATVPVYRAVVPWGPPFDPDLARDLLRGTRLADVRI
ncbi:hypothetical protein [Nocardioides sp. YIM 152588]|uniref:hypothetical protein n=1 Tax=Nocardioides sp. YIM 152588 TaxID=3158259 RepID=UPI0032E46ED2